MSAQEYSPSEVEARGEAIYEQDLRSKIEVGNLGKFVVMDVASGDYEVAEDDLTATRRILSRHPQGVLYGMRIGHRAAYRLLGTGLLQGSRLFVDVIPDGTVSIEALP